MSVIKRAIMYVVRKWQKSLIVFLVLTTVAAAMLAGLSILRASEKAAAQLRGQLGGTFSLELDLSNTRNMAAAGSADNYTGSYYNGDVLDDSVIQEVMKTQGITDYSGHMEAVANLKSTGGQYYELVGNSGNSGTYSDPFASAASIQGWTSLGQCPYFANGVLEIAQGELFSGGKSGQAVISRELAEKNQLSVGDEIVLEINRDITGFNIPEDKQKCTFKIAGIFDILGEQQVEWFMSKRQLLENWVFVDSQTLLPHMSEMMVAAGQPPFGYDRVVFSVDDPAGMDSILSDLQGNDAVNWECFRIEADDSSYKGAETSLKSMDGLIRTMVILIGAAAAAILILLLAIWSRSRVRETGILLAVGKSRTGIIVQRAAEVMVIAVFAFAASYFISRAAGNGVGNALLQQANARTEETGGTGQSIQPGALITSDMMDLTPVFAPPEVEELKVEAPVELLFSVYGLGLLAAVASVCIAGIPVMRMEPREILTKMS